MTKWKCENKECRASCVMYTENCAPQRCVNIVIDGICNWQEVKEDGKPNLPKLTAEVFDRPDCPEWANYAALGGGGVLIFYEDKPMMSKDEYPKRWINYDRWYPVEGTKFDASDWKNSLVERPAKLPDWCKVDAICWHKRCGYFKVTMIDNVSSRVDIQQVDGKSKGYLSFYTVCGDVCQARLRVFNNEEMKALVGKVIQCGAFTTIVLSYTPNYGGCRVDFSNKWITPLELLEEYTIGGKPCGKLEHLEDGEWKA